MGYFNYKILSSGSSSSSRRSDDDYDSVSSGKGNPDPEIIQAVKKGADVNANKAESFYIACGRGDWELAKLLIENGLDVNSEDNFYPSNPFKIVSKNMELVKLLVEKGMDVNLRNKHDETPLMLACRQGDTDFVKILIEKGADVNAKDEDGYTPLMAAISSKEGDIAKYLVKKGADVKAKDNWGKTALDYAKENPEMIKLIKAGRRENFIKRFTTPFIIRKESSVENANSKTDSKTK